MKAKIPVGVANTMSINIYSHNPITLNSFIQMAAISTQNSGHHQATTQIAWWWPEFRVEMVAT